MLSKEIINKMSEDELRDLVSQYGKLINKMDVLNYVQNGIEDTLRTYIKQVESRERWHNKTAEDGKRINDIEAGLFQKYFTLAPCQASNAEGFSKEEVGETND